MATQSNNLTLPLPFGPLPRRKGDVCARRSRGNERSADANSRVNPFKETIAESIRVQIVASGFSGVTINELRIFDDRKQRFKYPNELSPRLCELKSDGLIFDSHRERENCTVYVGRQEWVTPNQEKN